MENNNALTKFQVLLMTIATGASVANIYYNQPILKDIALTFDVTESKAGIISMLSQIGYGLGLFFIIPLGDKINKKNLIITLLILLIATLLLMTFSSSIQEVWLLSILIGIFSVSVQVILPMAASLNPASRGKTVGMILFSLLLIKLLPNSTVTLIFAVILLDIGIQGMQVTNVAMIYTLDQTAHSRINTIYMTSYFIGGALGTFVGLQCWKYGGWNLVVWQMLL